LLTQVTLHGEPALWLWHKGRGKAATRWPITVLHSNGSVFHHNASAIFNFITPTTDSYS